MVSTSMPFSRQAKSIALSKCPKSRTIALFIIFSVWAKVMMKKSPAEETESPRIHLHVENTACTRRDANDFPVVSGPAPQKIGHSFPLQKGEKKANETPTGSDHSDSCSLDANLSVDLIADEIVLRSQPPIAD